MHITKDDLLSPANFVTATGVALTTLGSLSLNTISGFLIVVAGRALDMVDGPVARRTHTSPFGAAVDATADKITGLILLIAAFHFRLVPTTVIAFLFFQHLFIALFSVVMAAKGTMLHVTDNGKHNMFLHLVVLFLFISAQFSSGKVEDIISVTASGLAVISVPLGLKTITEYIKQPVQPTRKR